MPLRFEVHGWWAKRGPLLMGPAVHWSIMGALSDPWSKILIKGAKWSHNYKSSLELGNPVLTGFSLADPLSFHLIDIVKEHINHKNHLIISPRQNLDFYSIKHQF